MRRADKVLLFVRKMQCWRKWYAVKELVWHSSYLTVTCGARAARAGDKREARASTQDLDRLLQSFNHLLPEWLIDRIGRRALAALPGCALSAACDLGMRLRRLDRHCDISLLREARSAIENQVLGPAGGLRASADHQWSFLVAAQLHATWAPKLQKIDRKSSKNLLD